MTPSPRRTLGFTLVELIVIILLLGILSAYAASRYLGKDSLSAYVAQEQAISIIRQIQVNRMQSNLSSLAENGHYRLMVSQSCLGSVAACQLSADQDTRRSDVLREENLTFSLSPSLSNETVFFDLLGNPVSESNQPLGDVIITITSPSSRAGVCINAQGYIAKQGEC